MSAIERGPRRRSTSNTVQGTGSRTRSGAAQGSGAPKGPSQGRSGPGPGEQPPSQPSPTLSMRSGATFFSLMTSKRLAKQVANKVYAKRPAGSSSISSKYGPVASSDVEPTYRTDPRVRLNEKEISAVLQEIVDQRMEDFTYSPKRSVMVSRILTEEIKERVKEMNYDRFKVVCVVTIGEDKGQGLRLTSRCLWDRQNDRCCTYNWKNGKAFCSAIVYCLYHE